MECVYERAEPSAMECQYTRLVGLRRSLASNYVDCVVKDTKIGTVGFAILNTAWRSTGVGESERNQLLLAERVVDISAEHLKACDIKIAVLHHPLDWLARWSEAAVRPPLLTNFDLILFGHVHEIMPTVISNAIGECLFAQGGTLYLDRKYYNGYQLIDITQQQGLTFDFHLRTWFDQPRRQFGPAENICAGGKKTFHIRAITETSQRLQTADLLAIQNAVDNLADAHLQTLQIKSGITFDDSFTCPPLSEKTHEELLQYSPTDYKAQLIILENVLAANGILVFSGPRESGKTTIAWKIAKQVLQTTSGPIRIPILVDFSLVRKYDALDRLVRRHLASLNVDFSAATVLAGYRCMFIIDNVSLADGPKVERLKHLVKDSGDKHDWCIFLDQIELLSSKTLIEEFKASRPPIFIQPFGRSEIRALVRKISPSPDESLDNTEAVIALINDNNLPRNPYIVTLLSSVLSKAALDAVINEATLLDKMIDLLLNKGAPENVIRSSTDFTGLNILLEQIAQWLTAENSYLPENQLLKQLAEYLTDRGIQESASDLLQHFITAGILERIGDDISFRYRSFEAYFLARYAARNKDFAPRLLDDLAIVRYAKEFSLLCDLSRKDADLLSYLEIVILELRPSLYEGLDKDAFVHVELRTNSEHVIDELLDHISSGPRTITKIDEAQDIHDRARSALLVLLRHEPF
jgi:DNA polymerase III delta prime subunit